MAVLIVHNDIERATDSGLVSALVLLDLSAAFDTVDHCILLYVLSSWFDVIDRAYVWFSSYLTGKTQVISTNTSTSEAVALTCGVLQGSCVGPQQFTAYTEDVHEQSNLSKLKMTFMQTTPRYSHMCVSVKFKVANQILKDVYL